MIVMIIVGKPTPFALMSQKDDVCKFLHTIVMLLM